MLNLGFNKIGMEGTAAVADALPTFIRSLRLLRVNADLHVDKLKTEAEVELINKGFRGEEALLMAVIFRNNPALHSLNLRLNHLGEEACQGIAHTLAMQMRVRSINKQMVELDHTLEDQIHSILVEGVREAANPPVATMVWDGQVGKRVAIQASLKTLFKSESTVKKEISQMRSRHIATPQPQLPPMEVYENHWRPVTAITDDESAMGGMSQSDVEGDLSDNAASASDAEGRQSPIIVGAESHESFGSVEVQIVNVEGGVKRPGLAFIKVDVSSAKLKPEVLVEESPVCEHTDIPLENERATVTLPVTFLRSCLVLFLPFTCPRHRI